MKKLLQPQFWLSLIVLFLLYSCNSVSKTSANSSSTEGSSDDIVFTSASVLPMDSETILKDQDVWVKAGKIHKIGKDLEVPAGAKVIQAEGKFLMPGISEMHAHIPVAKGEDDALVRETLFLYLANGITTIRGMLGNPYHLTLKEQVAADEILSPRIYTSGTSVNGNTVPSIEVADENIRAQREAGYDFLKLHPGLKMEVFDEVVATAKEVGIKYAGHVSVDVGIRHALKNDYASVDHLDGYLEGLVPASAGVNPNANGFFGFNFTELVDKSMMTELAQLTAEKNVAVVPTQTLFTRWLSPASPEEMAAEPEMKYMNPRTMDSWKKGKFGVLSNEAYSEERYEKYIEVRHHILKSLHEADVLFLLGSDAPQVFNVPGFSIHHEIQSIIDAGISPYEVLKSGTINPAKYFKQEGEYGVVKEGASADLILTTANPLDQPATIRDNLGVMVRGKWMPREELDASLKEIAAKYAAMNN
ncbi:MAG: amidohydrolase family protein [Bacteroidia bacterium]|nr:amidohydrolase family protein [Bacteroidia bacterium]